MSISLVAAAEVAFATLSAGILAHVIYQCFFSPLAIFPGPFLAKFSTAWRAYSAYKGSWNRDLVSLHRRLGPVVRIGPKQLSVIDPDAFLQIYGVKKAFVKSESYAVLKGSRPFDLAGERSEKVHGVQRRMVARAYTMEAALRLEGQVDELIAPLLRKLDDTAFSKSILDLGYWLQLFAFDVIGAVSFTKEFGFLSSGSDSQGTGERIFPKIMNAMNSGAWLSHASWLFRLHQKYILPVLGNFLAVNDRNGYFFQFAQREVQARKDTGGSDKDIVGLLFQEQQKKAELDDTSISFMMTSNVFAGSDTTSISLRAIFIYLIRHPCALAKLRSELQAQRTAGKLSSIVTAAEAEACPYLQAVIYESMRLHSPVGIMLDRDVPPEGMMIGGKFVPGGTVVGTSPWAIQLNPQIWGADVDEFRPERWLECEDPGYLRRFFFVFGGGTRTCIGRNISWVEIEKLVPTLAMRYDFKLAKDAKISESGGIVVFLLGLRVTVDRLED